MKVSSVVQLLTFVALIGMTGVAIFFGFGLAARDFGAATVEESLRQQNEAYRDLLTNACPSEAEWKEAYRKQGIATVFRDYSATTDGSYVGKDMSRVRTVLERPDRTEVKSGGILGFFDEKGCPVNP